MAVNGFVTVWNCAAAKAALRHAFPLSALDVYRQIRRIVFGHAFKHTFKNNPFRVILYSLHDGHDANAVLLQLCFVNRAVISVSSESVELPDNDRLKLLLRRVCNHALEIAPCVLRSRLCPVYIFADDGIAFALRKFVCVPKLAFNRLFRLAVR